MQHLSYLDILKNNKEFAKMEFANTCSVVVLSNVIVNPIAEFLQFTFYQLNVKATIEFGNFDNIVQDSAAYKTADFIIIFYDLIGLIKNNESALNANFIDKCVGELNMVEQNLQQSKTVIFNLLSNFFPLYYNAFNHEYLHLINTLNNTLKNAANNLYPVSLDFIVNNLGINQVIDNRGLYSSSAPYSLHFFKAYTYLLKDIIANRIGKIKKVVVMDCDNTLWKGIIGEDGIEGIRMEKADKQGVFFHEIQRQLVALKDRGVLICLCSKNNPEDVDYVLDNNENMLLKNEHIVLKKVNWKNKHENIRELASELNLGLDSFLFVDDSEFEINLVNAELPEVETLLVPKDIHNYPNLFSTFTSRFYINKVTTEDKIKTQQYKQEEMRNQAQQVSSSIDEYLESLELKIEVIKNNKTEIARISQLTQKTNQFNFTTKRYTEAEIKVYLESKNSEIICYRITDKFGDYGIVALIILNYGNVTVKLDTFLMSCRVIGRKVENKLIYTLLEYLKNKGFERLETTYIATPKNGQIKAFFDNLGFELITNFEQTKTYAMNIQTHSIEDINFINYNG